MRLLVAFALLSSFAVRAQPVSALDGSQWTHTRLFVTGGPLSRSASMRVGDAVSEQDPGPQPLGLHLSGAHFLRQAFGISLDLRADLMGSVSALTSRRVNTQAVTGAVQFALRWQPALMVGFELHGGFSVGRLPFLRTVAGDSSAEHELIGGPTVMGVFTIDPTTFLSVQVFGRGAFSVVGLGGVAVGGGLQARVRLFELGPLEVGLALTAEALLGRHSSSSRSVDDFTWRAGIGPSVQARHGGPTPLTAPTPEVPSLVGRVLQDTTAVVGATVVVRDQTVTTDGAGAFTVSGLGAGPATVSATAPGLKPGSVEVVVTPGTPVQVTVTLRPPTGPGSIKGVVRASPEKPLAGVKLTAGALTVTTDAAGAFMLEPVGPGPVKVKAALDGYAAADEVVQVSPEATTTLDLTLEPLAQRSKARIRGVISSAAGPVAKATVRIVELKLKQAVKADGRFEAEVAGGRYTLVIEAPKHVTQTRTVEVADGDQAIFQIELEKAR